MKYLLYEHQNTVTEVKAAGLASINACQKAHDEREAELYKTMAAIVVDNQNLDITDRLRELEQVSVSQHVFISCRQRR